MYQLEVKAALVAHQFPTRDGWSVTVDVDTMERAIGGTHPADKRARADAAYSRLENLGVTLGRKHPLYRRADIVAEHAQHGTVVVEVEGSSRRQREQAMYAAIGQLVVSMRHDSASVSYAIAVPEELEWRRQIQKLPLLVLARLKVRVFFVDTESVTRFPDETDVTERLLLGDETGDVLPDGADAELDDYLRQFVESSQMPSEPTA